MDILVLTVNLYLITKKTLHFEYIIILHINIWLNIIMYKYMLYFKSVKNIIKYNLYIVLISYCKNHKMITMTKNIHILYWVRILCEWHNLPV